MIKIIVYGDEVDCDTISFTSPVPSTNAVGEVKRVIAFTGNPPVALIKRMVEFGQ